MLFQNEVTFQHRGMGPAAQSHSVDQSGGVFHLLPSALRGGTMAERDDGHNRGQHQHM